MSRTHGEGTILQRKDGRWQASLMLDGQRCTVYGKSRREAAAKLAELKRRAGAVLPDPGRRTVADLVDEWLRVAAPSLRPKTLHGYRRICELYILPTLGEVRLSRLEPVRIERMLSGIRARRQAQHAYMALHRACAFAVRWRWLAENPCDRAERPQHRARRPAVWSAEQVRAFLEGARDHWLYPLWLTLLASGCRLGELLALAWQDVDLDTGSIFVGETLQRVGGRVVTGEPKTASGRRSVTLPVEAVQVLRQQRGRQVLAGLATGLVFPNTEGKPLHHSTVEHALRRECDRLGLPPLTPHGLRHLHASLLLAEGVPLPAVSRRLGHADPSITARVYSHVLPGRDPGAQAIGRALK